VPPALFSKVCSLRSRGRPVVPLTLPGPLRGNWQKSGLWPTTSCFCPSCGFGPFRLGFVFRYYRGSVRPVQRRFQVSLFSHPPPPPPLLLQSCYPPPFLGLFFHSRSSRSDLKCGPPPNLPFSLSPALFKLSSRDGCFGLLNFRLTFFWPQPKFCRMADAPLYPFPEIFHCSSDGGPVGSRFGPVSHRLHSGSPRLPIWCGFCLPALIDSSS